MSRIALVPLVLLASAALAPNADAQASLASMRPPAVQRADSARALRSARSAQAEFERVRFAHLPWIWESGGGSECDERIGRFCLTYTDTEEDWHAPLEHREVLRARHADRRAGPRRSRHAGRRLGGRPARALPGGSRPRHRGRRRRPRLPRRGLAVPRAGGLRAPFLG